MAKQLKKRTAAKTVARVKRKYRKRGRVMGSADKPRLSVFKSNKNIYAQIIDDSSHKVLCQASSIKDKKGHAVDAAMRVGEQIAKLAVAKKVKKIVFDVSGYKYHGRVKSLAEAARKGGVSF